MSAPFNMPIIHTRQSVTWLPTERDKYMAWQNHGQTLERLAERGGVDWAELDAILSGEGYYAKERDEKSSMARVGLILRQRAE